MGKKNYKNPKKVIDLDNGASGRYIIYCLDANGSYIRSGVPKNIGNLLPFIDSKAYGGITIRAKKDILFCSKSRCRSKLVKKLREIKL